MVVGVVFGLLPAIRLSRAEFGAVVKQGGPTSTSSVRWTRDALVFVEMALAVVLIGAGGLVLRSFANVMRVDPGMDPRHVLTLQVTPPARIAPDAVEERAVFFRNALDAVRSVRGIQATALTDNLLMTGTNRGSNLNLDGIASKLLYTRGNWVTEVHVTPEYFRAMGMTIMRGAPFPSDLNGDEQMAIVADRMGRFAGIDPLGRDVVSLMKDMPRRYRVVGIIPESRDRGLDADPMSTVYLPFKAEGPATLIVRGDNPLALAIPARKAIQGFEPAAMVDQIRTLEDLVHASVAERRFNAFLYGAFSVSALGLSMIGVYGVIAYAVSRRTREIGIRVALGATAHDVIALVTRRMALVVGAGLFAGLGSLIALQTMLRSLVFNLQPNDPATLAAAVGLICGAALTAAYLPARRAARVDPMIALRAE
jgi:putative ABC transport system permease protein